MAKRKTDPVVKKDEAIATERTGIAIVRTRNELNGKVRAFAGVSKAGLFNLLDDKILTIEAIESGLPYESFEIIYEQSPYTQAFWAKALGLSTKSLNRYKQTGRKFKPLQSEKIIELAEVSSMGKKVFDNDEDFELWLNTPSLALGHNKPIDLIKNSYGKELVLTELINIDQGIFV